MFPSSQPSGYSVRAIWDLLVYAVLPLWVFAGFLDYLCHRISDRVGKGVLPQEALIHWSMLAEVAVPLLLAVFFSINALVIAVMLIALVAHEMTGYLDLRLAMATRKVTIFEHQVHSALEILPLTAILLVMALHWPQTEALFGAGPEHADFTVRWKGAAWRELLPPALLFLIGIIFPYAEELYREIRRKT